MNESKESPTRTPPDTIILSGGSIKGFLTLGAIQYIHDNLNTTSLTTFIGSSCGALIAYLLVIGYTPIEIMVYICTHDVLPKMTSSMDIVNAVNGQGAISFNFIHNILEKMTIEKVGRLLTMKELFEKSNKHLLCVTYNLTKDKPEILSHISFPDLPCLTAVRMSSNLPLIFGSFKYQENFYIDGGITDNLGLRYIPTESKSSIAINIVDDMQYKPNSNILEFMYHILAIPIRQLTKNVISEMTEKNKNLKILNLRDDKQPKVYDFNIKSSTRFEMFSNGYNACKEFLSETN